MTIKNLIFQNTYRDSVVLMRLSQVLEVADGVEQATAIMGSENNKALLETAGLLSDEGRLAGPNDLILALRITSAEREASVMAKTQELLAAERNTRDDGSKFNPRTVGGALEAMPGANLALISVPGRYAAYEAARALDNGLHVLLFSDNVSIEDEAALKAHAIERGLLMLGPDCGTAIINNVPLGFANEVLRGRVGLVSASGTGLQQVVCLLAAAGEGVSQALGVGGRDLDDRIGGAMMLEGLRALKDDSDTEVIVLVSKPPGEATRSRIFEALGQCSKPCVVCFLGIEVSEPVATNTFVVPTLEDASLKVLELLGHEPSASGPVNEAALRRKLEALNSTLGDGQRLIRGLYSGGTLCYEALLIMRQLDNRPLFSNLEMPGVRPMEGGSSPEGHLLIDLGDDIFTVGRPHPIIDLRGRCQQLVQEASEPEVGVLLLDVILGYGAHPDPASEIAPALREAQRKASEMSRGLACVVVLCGTSGDPQSLANQRAALESAGAVVVTSNVQAARIATALSRGDLSLVQGDI